MNYTIQLWVKKIKTNDPNQVSELYHKNGLLLGTFSSIERYGKKLILDRTLIIAVGLLWEQSLNFWVTWLAPQEMMIKNKQKLLTIKTI